MAALAPALPTDIDVKEAADAEVLVAPTLYSCNLEVQYPTEELAQIVMAALAVDAELQPDKVKRAMAVKGQRLVVSFVAAEARFLRAAFSAFMDILTLATRTIEEFGVLT